MSYSVRRLRPAMLAVVPPLAAFLLLVGRLMEISPLFLAVAALLALSSLWSASLVLAVDRRGVRFGGPLRQRNDRTTPAVPWSSIRAVVVWGVGPAGLGGGVPEVGVRLRPEAPLPRGVRAVVHDPTRPDDVAPELRVDVPNLDRDRLVAAVQAHGGGVPLVEGP